MLETVAEDTKNRENLKCPNTRFISFPICYRHIRLSYVLVVVSQEVHLKEGQTLMENTAVEVASIISFTLIQLGIIGMVIYAIKH